MGDTTRTGRDRPGVWVKRVLRAGASLAAVGGLMVVAAGQVGAAGPISVTVPSDLNRLHHQEGVPYTGMGAGSGSSNVLATFIDSGSGCPGACLPASDYTATITWGDTSGKTTCPAACTITAPTAGGSTYSITAAHEYSDEFNTTGVGGFTVNVSVTNTVSSALSSGSGVIAVEDQPQNAGPPFTFSPSVNVVYNGEVGVFQDGNNQAQLTDNGGGAEYTTVSIAWGDNSSSNGTVTIDAAGCGSQSGLGSGQGCLMDVSGSHKYTGQGTYNVQITITDGADPTQLKFSSTATVGTPGCAGNTTGTHFYTLDGFGGIHPDGVAANATSTGYWQNWDIARGIGVLSDDSGGYVMDAYGGLHPFSVGSCSMPANVTNEAYWANQNNLRGLAIAPWATSSTPAGYTVDLHGGVHAFGNAPAITNAPYWPTLDIIRGIVILPDSTPTSAATVGGYTLDAYGGVHPWGDAPAVTTPAYFPGMDMARGIVILPTATVGLPAGYTLDAHGGVHAFGAAPAVTGAPSWGGDIARTIILLPGSNNSAAGGYVMDLYGGPHPFGTASALANGTYAYWPSWAIARGLGENGEGSTVRKI